MQLKRVFVTGLGAVSPFGVGMQPLMQGLTSGSSAVVNLKAEWEKHITEMGCWVGAPLKGGLDMKAIPRTFRRFMGPSAGMAWYSAREAMLQAGVTDDMRASGRMGIAFASTTGSVASYSDFFEKYIGKQPFKDVGSSTFFQVMSHTSAANLSHAFNIRGRVISPDCACSSASQAIGLGYETVQSGRQDAMICGGSDELHPLVTGSFDLVFASSIHFNDRPEATPRPFDKDRDGTVCGDGAGCLVLESEESAARRKAQVLAEIIGFCTLADGGNLAQPNSESIERCLRGALDDAGVKPEQVDYVNAHATGTPQGDAAEAQAVCRVFGVKKVLVSGFKGHMGHTTGASGALELAAVISSVNQGLLIPTRNLDAPSEDCACLLHVEGLKKRPSDIYIKNSFAFGGINSVLVLRRPEHAL